MSKIKNVVALSETTLAIPAYAALNQFTDPQGRIILPLAGTTPESYTLFTKRARDSDDFFSSLRNPDLISQELKRWDDFLLPLYRNGFLIYDKDGKEISEYLFSSLEVDWKSSVAHAGCWFRGIYCEDLAAPYGSWSVDHVQELPAGYAEFKL